MPTPVTNSSQMAESGSSRKPTSALNGAAAIVLEESQMPVSLPSQVYIIFSNGRPACCAAKPLCTATPPASEQKRQNHGAHADRVHERMLLGSLRAKEENDGPWPRADPKRKSGTGNQRVVEGMLVAVGQQRVRRIASWRPEAGSSGMIQICSRKKPAAIVLACSCRLLSPCSELQKSLRPH